MNRFYNDMSNSKERHVRTTYTSFGSSKNNLMCNNLHKNLTNHNDIPGFKEKPNKNNQQVKSMGATQNKFKIWKQPSKYKLDGAKFSKGDQPEVPDLSYNFASCSKGFITQAGGSECDGDNKSDRFRTTGFTPRGREKSPPYLTKLFENEANDKLETEIVTANLFDSNF